MSVIMLGLPFLALATGTLGAAQQAGDIAPTLLERNYPQASLERGEQGAAEFAVDLDEMGRLESCLITRSSGFPRLDEATCNVLIEHIRFKVAETAPIAGEKSSWAGTMNWKLPAAHQANASRAPRPQKVSVRELDAKKIICRRDVALGSFIKPVAYCLTKAQWAASVDEVQRNASTMINPVNSGQ